MKLTFFIQKRGKGQYVVDVFSMTNVHYFNDLFFIIYVTNQTIIPNSVPPEFLQITFEGMPKKTRIFFKHKMGRNICGNFFLNRPINLIKLFFSFPVKTDFPERGISRQVCAFSQLLQKKYLRHFHFPFLQDVEKRRGNLAYFQETPQPLSEYNNFQTDVFLKQAQKEELQAFLGDRQLT